ncbi:hypothetical protein DPX16_18525 [Anabarilius grahami]|uniref:Uncharacterized protein n=1 Tax=Anabarilius grahami TaxID=495550 RepID=A0A3N0YJQ3_ANAGA|nr:hypothetical protein DPX16_18525 [Anabarilius grahami]
MENPVSSFCFALPPVTVSVELISFQDVASTVSFLLHRRKNTSPVLTLSLHSCSRRTDRALSRAQKRERARARESALLVCVIQRNSAYSAFTNRYRIVIKSMQFAMCVCLKYFHTSEADIVSAAAAVVSVPKFCQLRHVRYRSLVSGVFLRVRVQVHELGIGSDTEKPRTLNCEQDITADKGNHRF